MMLKIGLFLLFIPAAAMAAGFPEAEISNGIVRARLHLPVPGTGFYQGTRFDWSGAVSSLQYKGHEFFGQWFERYDPKIHDAITGPVEEFLTRGSGLGYTEAKPGGTFLRIGVGTVRKPHEPAYQRFHTYDIVDHGKWSTRKGTNWIEFVHELKDPSGYAYVYAKTLRLVQNQPVLVLEHTLQNTGQKSIETDQYNHNFFMIDRQPVGPGCVVIFPFEVHAQRDLQGLAKVADRKLEFLKELEPGKSVFTELGGFGSSPKDYDFRIENRQAGAGVRIKGDQPIVNLFFWSIRTTLCPEPYIRIKVDPGQSANWKIDYQFYSLPN
ncbi:MAG TPA: hypothetical protein P5186_07455 [Candidatus Paceibacterota bacterium]|nr:hypothetical protein [Verrucomicrobiota bacterium]HRY47866.1 hypothetical protein [Candidatus Paceibacterota bacterium]